jgi:hypothetical protein
MYLCVRGISYVFVCLRYRLCIYVLEVSVFVCLRYRLCIYVLEVSVIYLCVRGCGYVLVF